MADYSTYPDDNKKEDVVTTVYEIDSDGEVVSHSALVAEGKH